MATWPCASCGGENPEGTRFCGRCGAAAAPAADQTAPPAAPPSADVSDTLRSFVAGQVADRLVEAGGDLPEERRLITALFADVSGFTTLADRLDPEELLEVIDPVISALSSVVGRYEGYVEKFAGDALLALFGAPIAHEDDAERAVHAGLEMHRQLARICSELGPNAAGLTLHVGINSGHGIARVLGSEARMDYAVLGDSVILAQRLESAAPPGETYVSDLTYRLTRGAFTFEPVGELTLKGKVEAVHAWRLVGVRGSADRFAAGPSSFVGREREVAQVDDALRGVDSGAGVVVAVTGEPGVGKSRLTAEVREAAERRRTRWLETRCLAYGAGLAYWPYATLVRSFAGIQPDDEPPKASDLLLSALGGDARVHSFFARLLELPRDGEGTRLEPEAFRRGLHEAFSSWLRALAEEQPTVVAIEDVHWADASSLALTEELGRMCASAPLALYLIARPEGAPQLERIAAAADRAAVCSIALDRLGAHAVAALVSGLLGGRPPERLATDIADRTAGNPFFVEETVRALQENGDLYRDDGSWAMRGAWDPDTMPPTVEGLLASRIDLLPRPAASLLQTASVIGRRMRIDLLRAVTDGDDAIDEPLARLVESNMLDPFEEDGRAGVSFHHALVQEVAYSRLLRRRRRDLHLRVAEVAEGLFGAGDENIDLLARHLYLAEAGTKAVHYLLRAGRRAKRLFANDEAILHLSRALELAPQETEVRLELADLHKLVGSYDDGLRLYREVRDSTGDVRAWGGIAAILRNQGEYRQALEQVDEAFRAEELADADLAPLWLEQARTLTAFGRPSQAIDVLEAGLAARAGDRDGDLAEMLSHLAVAETMDGKAEEALDHALRARELFAAVDDLRGIATAERVLGDAYLKLDRLDEAAAALRRALEAAERVGSAEEIGGSLLNLGILEFMREDLTSAIDCDRRAIAQFERIGHTSGRAQAYANLGYKLSQAGEHQEALEYCERGIALAREIGDALAVADVTDTIAAVCLAENDLAAAVERGEEAARLYMKLGAIPQAAGALEIAANALERAGERAQAVATRARAKELEQITA
jgi:adenylate cyclase